MRQVACFMLILFTLAAFSAAWGQTPEDEKIAKSLYLKASKAIRAEDYKGAEKLLIQILDEYPDSEVSLLADEKLSDIADKATLASLPKTPGFYWVENSGEIQEMPQKRVNEGAPYEYGTEWITVSKEQVTEIFADELQKFIVYRPKGELQDVYWTSFSSILTFDENGEPVPSGNFRQYREWAVPSVEGKPFGSSQVVFEEIKPGMWEVGFPTVFSPANPILCGLSDGTGNVGLVFVLSKMVHSFYPFLKFWEKDQITAAQTKYISKQMKKHPDNLDLLFFDAVMKYKMAYKQNEPKTEALEVARTALERAQTGEITPKVLTDLHVLAEYCIADSLVRANAIHPDDTPEVKAEKKAALLAYSSSKVPSDLYWIQEQIARNYAACGDFDECFITAEKAIDTFKDNKPDTGTSLFGIAVVSVELEIGEPDVPEAFNIHDALTCYSTKPEWERVKDLDDFLESEQYLYQAMELTASGGTPKEIEKALKESKSSYKNNIRCYEAMVEFYTKIGKPKDAEKAQKDIKKAEERLTKLEMERASS